MKAASSNQTKKYIALATGFGLLVAIIVGLLIFVTAQITKSKETVEEVSLQKGLLRVFQQMQDAETGQRGFLLTGDKTYLAPYRVALSDVDANFKFVLDGFVKQGEQIASIIMLRSLVDQKMAELKATIDLEKSGKHSDAISIVATNAGKITMDRIRDLMSSLATAQRVRFETAAAAASLSAQRLLIFVTVIIVMTAALGVSAIVELRKQMAMLRAADYAARRANAQMLLDARQHEQLSIQLRQSQKMEAIGQLTGGVAHDFNNMLAVVIGSLNLLKRRLAKGDTDIMRFIDGAMDGATRAATLTHRLLAFSRQQPLAPVSLDLDKMVAGMAELLRRTLGDEVQLETVMAGGIWRTRADPSQLENSILNLAVNARDAMPDGGRLTIETSNSHLDEHYAARHIDVPAGQFVLLAVSDTGIGMTKDVADKAFDPFFTTKPVGLGTGLGLSQVFGFVRQSGGHVKVYSEVGHGTTIKIYLPRFLGTDEAIGLSVPRTTQTRVGKPNEVILVVEDDDRVRLVAVETLRDLNYTVIHAMSAATALQLLDSHPEISLLFTDIVMPETNGRDLAAMALVRRPDLKVLYTTGYTRNAVVHNGILDAGVDLIGKPYSIEDLGRKVREVLDRA